MNYQKVNNKVKTLIPNNSQKYAYVAGPDNKYLS